MPTEITPPLEDQIRAVGQEYGTTTGRARRIGWIDLVQLKYANQLNGFTELILTKVDVLTGLPKVKLCVGYEINGKKIDYVPADLESFAQIKPIYETLPGWGSLPEHIKNIDECPVELKSFIKKIEEFTGNSISLISYGPDRNQTFAL